MSALIGFQITVAPLPSVKCLHCGEVHDGFLATLDGTEHQARGQTPVMAVTRLMLLVYNQGGEIISYVVCEKGWGVHPMFRDGQLWGMIAGCPQFMSDMEDVMQCLDGNLDEEEGDAVSSEGPKLN